MTESPPDPYLPTYLGLRYLRNYDRPEPAAEQFRRALARDSTFAQAHYWLSQDTEDVGKYMVLWAKTPDGWRIYRDMWTSDRRPDRR